MKKNTFFIRKLEQLLETGIFWVSRDGILETEHKLEFNPLACSRELREILIQGATGQEFPFLYRDSYDVYYGCICVEDKDYILLGPMSQETLEGVQMHQYYRHYGIEQENEKALRKFPLQRILNAMELAAWEFLGTEYSDEVIIHGNNIVKIQDSDKEGNFQLRSNLEDEERYHHTYNEERRLLDYIREGNVDAALACTKNMDRELGRLSEKELNHWKNVSVAAVTLCTRAAIEGGVAPSVAYRFSDFYIQKCDSCTDIVQILEWRNRAVEEIARRVKEMQERRSRFNYVEKCKDYVENHYRAKIYQKDMAQELGISSSYLSRLFHRETGMRLQDYIVQVRVEHAANLLLYSNESIARIAEYVNFPSQSYMGKVFKEYRNMSPREYRERGKPTGF